jgi:hypothetical protein
MKTTTTNRSFPLPLHTTFHKAKQSIGWELVASTNHTDNCSAGDEPEYDYICTREEIGESDWSDDGHRAIYF